MFGFRVDCPSCLVEGAAIETWGDDDGAREDGACCRLGVPQLLACRLCGLRAQGVVHGASSTNHESGCPGCGSALDDAARASHVCPTCRAYAGQVETATPTPFPDLPVDELERALQEWAVAEGLSTGDELLSAYFDVVGPGELHAALQRRERVETTFDVADYFLGGGVAGPACTVGPRGGAIAMEVGRAPLSSSLLEKRAAERTLPLARTASPRDELRAIASVLAADGETGAADVAWLARAAEARGIAPIERDELRVWRPNELPPPPTLEDRERVLEEMFRIGTCGGDIDDSELRVVREFARAWGVDPDRLRQWAELYTMGEPNPAERWLRRLGLFLLPPETETR